jgi:hypothetical protein
LLDGVVELVPAAALHEPLLGQARDHRAQRVGGESRIQPCVGMPFSAGGFTGRVIAIFATGGTATFDCNAVLRDA